MEGLTLLVMLIPIRFLGYSKSPGGHLDTGYPRRLDSDSPPARIGQVTGIHIHTEHDWHSSAIVTCADQGPPAGAKILCSPLEAGTVTPFDRVQQRHDLPCRCGLSIHRTVPYPLRCPWFGLLFLSFRLVA